MSDAGSVSPTPKQRASAPWWWPSAQSVVAVGMFALTFYVIRLFSLNPDLDKHVLFVSLATGIVLTDLGIVVGFFFGSSVSSAKKDATASVQAGTIAALTPGAPEAP